MRGGAQNIREAGARTFWKRFCESSLVQRQRTETAIGNLYWPDVEASFGVSRTKSRRLILPRRDYASLQEQIRAHAAAGLPLDTAKALVYGDHGTPVTTAEAWCKYMKIGASAHEPDHFIVTLWFSAAGLYAVDDSLQAIAWGDDFVLEALADCYQREIFVILLSSDSMFFLPHAPASGANDGSSPQAPIFLLMRTDDHYEPMCAVDMGKQQIQENEPCAVLGD